MRWITFTKLTKNLMTMLVRDFYAKKKLAVAHEMDLFYLSTSK